MIVYTILALKQKVNSMEPFAARKQASLGCVQLHKAVISLEQTWIKRSSCCDIYENAWSSAEWSREFMALPMKCALFLSH